MVYIYRKLEKTLKKYMDRKEILAVIGPRQAGKTTLIKHILQDYKNVNYINFDDINKKTLFIENIDAFITQNIEPFDYVFIDEIQYVQDAGQKLKFIYDTQKTKLIISGSSATEVSISSLKYLVGRVFIYHLYPLSLEEFLNYKNKNLLETIKKSKSYKSLHNFFKPLLEEYIIYGGYPSVVIAKTNEEKKTILKNIYNTFFLREIKEIFFIKDDYKLVKLLKALSLQIGNIINYQELSSITDFSVKELKEHMSILNKTFVCQEAFNFNTNKRNELKKSPKIFFIDTGLRNTIINNFFNERSDMGALNENLVAQEIIKKEIDLLYWRTQSKAEVDFIIEKEGKIIPIEVKSNLKKSVLGKSLFSFIEHYKSEKVIVISNEYENKRKIKNSEILFIPFVKFPFIKL
ncbi:MAG: ATP-binding protein [Candidatus Woesearchaeota archaeon]